MSKQNSKDVSNEIISINWFVNCDKCIGLTKSENIHKKKNINRTQTNTKGLHKRP